MTENNPLTKDNGELFIEALKMKLLASIGYNPSKETLEDFCIRLNEDYRKRTDKLEEKILRLSAAKMSPLEAIKLLIKDRKIKGKGERFLIMLSTQKFLSQSDLMTSLKINKPNTLSDLKRRVLRKLGQAANFITIKSLHGKDGKKGYILSINYSYLDTAENVE